MGGPCSPPKSRFYGVMLKMQDFGSGKPHPSLREPYHDDLTSTSWVPSKLLGPHEVFNRLLPGVHTLVREESALTNHLKQREVQGTHRVFILKLSFKFYLYGITPPPSNIFSYSSPPGILPFFMLLPTSLPWLSSC